MEIVMSGIAKAFGTNQVLRDVSITLKEGEVHALMGENGAVKSTLMRRSPFARSASPSAWSAPSRTRERPS